ncbi:MAG: response regulator transcription factor [bacterium]
MKETHRHLELTAPGKASPAGMNTTILSESKERGIKQILIVEDDAAIALGLESALRGEGYETLTARAGKEGFRLAQEQQPDLLILDLMLPGMSGLEICKRIRDQGLGTPVIMLTSKAEENDKVLGLEIGADDYVTKPFSLRELLARVKAHLRREEAAGSTVTAARRTQFAFGEVTVDLKRHEVRNAGKLQELTPREFRILEYFLAHPGELISRDRLLGEVWGYELYPTTRTIDSHIHLLRTHIELDPGNPRYIKTVHGVGYLFELEESVKQKSAKTSKCR